MKKIKAISIDGRVFILGKQLESSTASKIIESKEVEVKEIQSVIVKEVIS